MKQTCRITNQEFEISPDEVSFYEKMGVPLPELHPDLRLKWRALWRNETTLYSGRKCDLCNKSIISMYNPKLPYPVYCYNCFYSEKWDPKNYATDYDFSRSFIDQMKEFLAKVPKITLYLSLGYGENVNSEYVNMASGCKNCYLVFNTGLAEELLYSRGMRKGTDSSDLYFGFSDDRCYESVNIEESSGVTFGQNVAGCVDSHFLLNCSGLTNCFGCVNLRGKSNCFFNEQLTSDEYKKKIDEILGSYQKIEEYKKKFETFALQFPMRENNNLKSVNSTGNYLSECKNVHSSFEVFESEDCRYVFSSKLIRDSMGIIGYGTNSEKLLECVATGYTSNTIATYGAENCSNILYGFYTSNCHDCIGCDALRNCKYAIFNKEYSKEEYEKIQEHIISELKEKKLYGLMMPPELAPFAYNETIAQDNFPLSKEEVLKLGFRWENEIQMTKGKETLAPEKIPDHIYDVPESITQEILCCVACERNYKITVQELQFYKKMNISIPRQCFYCRHTDRIRRRGPFQFWDRKCAKCEKSITTNYPPERSEIVYCEECYRKEVM